MRHTTVYTPYAPYKRRQERDLPGEGLAFRPVTADAISDIRRCLGRSGSRANDFTIGGILMWVDYFHYEYCITGDTLFLKGVSELHPEIAAFSLPVGAMPLTGSIAMLKDYCRRQRMATRLSAVPEDRLADLLSVTGGAVEELADWSDYIYEADKLATLSGKALGKKRNHVNRFMADNEGWSAEWLSAANMRPAREAYMRWLGSGTTAGLDAASAIEESAQTLAVMDDFGRYPFEGLVLNDGAGRVVAFTMGEVIGDTLYTHIEKMDHEVAGAGETINKLFAERILERHPEIVYINREEDAGDPGLRQAKLSYHPAIVLHKYDVVVD